MSISMSIYLFHSLGGAKLADLVVEHMASVFGIWVANAVELEVPKHHVAPRHTIWCIELVVCGIRLA